MQAIAIDGAGQQQLQSFAHMIARELKRRRHTVACWRLHSGEDVQQPDHAAVLLENCGQSSRITRPGAWRLEQYLPYLHEDFLLILGAYPGLPKLLVLAEEPPAKDGYTLATLSGQATAGADFQLPAQLPELVDYLIVKTPPLLPFPDGNPCCQACGKQNCPEMVRAMLQGQAQAADCRLRAQQAVEIKINGVTLPLVAFVQHIIHAGCLGMVATLEGYEENSRIEIVLHGGGENR